MNLFEEFFQGDLTGLGELGLPFFLQPVQTDLLGHPLIFTDQELLPGIGHPAETVDLHRTGGRSLIHFLTPIVVEGPYLPKMDAADKRVPGLQGSPLNEHRSYRPPPFIQPGFHHPTSGRFFGIGFQFQNFGLQQDHFQEMVHPLAGFGRDFGHNRFSPHSSGASPYSANCLLTRSGLALGLSTLLTATIIGTPAARA